MKIIRNLKGETPFIVLSITHDEPLFTDELIAIAEAVGAYDIIRTTYVRRIKAIAVQDVECRTTIETKRYGVKIEGRDDQILYTRDELIEALASYSEDA